jgi:hypothetical protein
VSSSRRGDGAGVVENIRFDRRSVPAEIASPGAVEIAELVVKLVPGSQRIMFVMPADVHRTCAACYLEWSDGPVQKTRCEIMDEDGRGLLLGHDPAAPSREERIERVCPTPSELVPIEAEQR